MVKKHTEMRGIKLDPSTGFVFLSPSYRQFLTTMYGKKMPDLLSATINDFLDAGDLQTLDDMKKVIKFYEWREDRGRDDHQKRLQRLTQYIQGLEDALQRLLEERQLQQSPSAPAEVPAVPPSPEIRRAMAVPTRAAAKGSARPTEIPAGPTPARGPSIHPPVPGFSGIPGGLDAEGEIGSDDLEASESIRQIQAKIKSVKERAALHSDEEIERMFAPSGDRGAE